MADRTWITHCLSRSYILLGNGRMRCFLIFLILFVIILSCFQLSYLNTMQSLFKLQRVGTTQCDHRNKRANFVQSIFEKMFKKKGGKDKLIVWYNGATRSDNTSLVVPLCCGNYTCRMSHNPKDFDYADGVIVNAFYLNPEEKPPQRSHANQIWMFFTKEPDINLRKVKWPSKYWNTLFNWTVSYRSDCDFQFPYAAIVKINAPKKNWLEIAKSKNRSAAWFVGNCHTHGQREDYVSRLQHHGAQVDVYGKCGKLKLPNDMEGECYKSHRFYLAFENGLCEDYVTEKLFKVMKHDVVPIVRGGADYSNILPVGSFIDTANFKTPEDLANYLLYLDKNVTAYAELLKTKAQYRSSYPQPWCDVCKRLHELPSYSKTYPDIQQWLDIKKCYKPKDL